MQSSTLVLTVGLLAYPLALVGNPQSAQQTSGLLQFAQVTVPPQNAPDQTINGRPLTDAPVSHLAPPGVSPADRAGGAGSRDLAAGPVNSTPFSAAPTSAQQSGSPALSNGTSGGDVTPNLGR